MQRAALWTTLALSLSLLSGRATAGPITYDLVDYADYQNGYTLSGSITTDGFIGDLWLALEHILSWTVTISQGSYSHTFDSTLVGSAVVSPGRLYTSETEIWIGRSDLDPAFWNSLLALSTLNSNPNFPPDQIQWSISWSGTTYDATSLDRIEGVYWHTSPPFVDAFVIARASSAAVPEPASLALAGCGAVVVASLGVRRRS